MAGPGPRPNLAVKTLPFIGQDLPGHAVPAQRTGQRQAHRPGRRPQHGLRAHDEPGVVIDAGDYLDFLPAGVAAT
jgi:hypothetical protein